MPPGAASSAVPAQLRLFGMACGGAIDLAALTHALRVELRTMGGDLVEGDSRFEDRIASAGPEHADLRFVVYCESGMHTSSLAEFTLVHGGTGQSIDGVLEVGPPSPDQPRILAVALSERIREGWQRFGASSSVETAHGSGEGTSDVGPGAADTHDPQDGGAQDRDAQDAQDRDAQFQDAQGREVRGRGNAGSVPSGGDEEVEPARFFDVALGIHLYPVASYAAAELRLGFSAPIGASLRIGVELAGITGWAPDDLGDVWVGGIVAAAALRYASETATRSRAVGLRVDAGFLRARGSPSAEGVVGGTLDAPQLTVVLDARFRFQVGRTWILVAPEVGASILGVDARADERRVTGQIGPRVGLLVGLSWAHHR